MNPGSILMAQSRHITILSGGGSPHTEDYGPVYRLIDEEGRRLGWSTHLLDYVGVGHAPDFGMGLSLPGAVEKSRQDLKAHPAPQGSTLICRSFGCDVGAHLLANHRDEMTSFSRVVFWGPSAYHVFWDLVARTPQSLATFNEEARKKGVVLSADFWTTFEPIEESAKQIKGITVEIGYGTSDKYCDAPLANYLAAIFWKHTDCPVRVVEIKGAAHEIRPTPHPVTSPEDHERIKREYFALIFGSDPESGIGLQES